MYKYFLTYSKYWKIQKTFTFTIKTYVFVHYFPQLIAMNKPGFRNPSWQILLILSSAVPWKPRTWFSNPVCFLAICRCAALKEHTSNIVPLTQSWSCIYYIHVKKATPFKSYHVTFSSMCGVVFIPLNTFIRAYLNFFTSAGFTTYSTFVSLNMCLKNENSERYVGKINWRETVLIINIYLNVFTKKHLLPAADLHKNKHLAKWRHWYFDVSDV